MAPVIHQSTATKMARPIPDKIRIQILQLPAEEHSFSHQKNLIS